MSNYENADFSGVPPHLMSYVYELKDANPGWSDDEVLKEARRAWQRDEGRGLGAGGNILDMIPARPGHGPQGEPQGPAYFHGSVQYEEYLVGSQAAALGTPGPVLKYWKDENLSEAERSGWDMEWEARQGKSYKDIAKEHGLSIPAVKSRISRARQKFDELIVQARAAHVVANNGNSLYPEHAEVRRVLTDSSISDDTRWKRVQLLLESMPNRLHDTFSYHHALAILAWKGRGDLDAADSHITDALTVAVHPVEAAKGYNEFGIVALQRGDEKAFLRYSHVACTFDGDNITYALNLLEASLLLSEKRVRSSALKRIVRLFEQDTPQAMYAMGRLKMHPVLSRGRKYKDWQAAEKTEAWSRVEGQWQALQESGREEV